MVIVQVVANPLISLLGPPQTVHSRLTFAQAFNTLGTTSFPIVGSALILGGLAGGQRRPAVAAPSSTPIAPPKRQAIVNTYIGLAVALAVIAGRGVAVPQPAEGRAA